MFLPGLCIASGKNRSVWCPPQLKNTFRFNQAQEWAERKLNDKRLGFTLRFLPSPEELLLPYLAYYERKAGSTDGKEKVCEHICPRSHKLI